MREAIKRVAWTLSVCVLGWGCHEGAEVDAEVEVNGRATTAAAPPAVQTRQAEAFTEMSGIYTTPGLPVRDPMPGVISYVDDGDWVRYRSVNFGAGHAIARVRARVATPYAGGHITFHVGSLDGPVLADIAVEPTGTWYRDFVSQATAASAGITGVHDVYVRFSGPGNGSGWGIADVDWFKFERLAAPYSSTVSVGIPCSTQGYILLNLPAEETLATAYVWRIYGADGTVTTHTAPVGNTPTHSYGLSFPKTGTTRLNVRAKSGSGFVSKPLCFELEGTVTSPNACGWIGSSCDEE
jgi:hypothetical protein